MGNGQKEEPWTWYANKKQDEADDAKRKQDKADAAKKKQYAADAAKRKQDAADAATGEDDDEEYSVWEGFPLPSLSLPSWVWWVVGVPSVCYGLFGLYWVNYGSGNKVLGFHGYGMKKHWACYNKRDIT